MSKNHILLLKAFVSSVHLCVVVQYSACKLCTIVIPFHLSHPFPMNRDEDTYFGFADNISILITIHIITGRGNANMKPNAMPTN